MLLPIEPYVGIGPVKLGMSVSEVRGVLKGEVDSYMKSDSDALPSDAFDSVGVHVYYKPPGVCEAVEVASPAVPIFRGRPLLDRHFDEVRKWFEEMDGAVELDESGLTSYKFGIGLYAPGANAAGSVVETVIVFERGYYSA